MEHDFNLLPTVAHTLPPMIAPAAALIIGLQTWMLGWELKHGRAVRWTGLRVDRKDTPSFYWFYIAARALTLAFLVWLSITFLSLGQY